MFDRQQLLDDYWNLVAQTAEFRYCIKWAGARALMAERGYPAEHVIMSTCDQGHDVCVNLALVDGQLVTCDFKEDPSTRDLVSVSCWKPWTLGIGEPPLLETAILATPHLKDSFDRAVLAYFDFHARGSDRPLPVVPPRPSR